jgi:ATP-dependent DNA ligase
MVEVMLLTELENEQRETAFDDYKGYFFQEKFNGHRALILIENEEIVSIRNRRDNACFHLYPELKELTFKGIKQAILDIEMCVFDNQGKSIFYGGINQRDKKLYQEHIKLYPITAVVFDILSLNDDVKVAFPYEERYKLLVDNFQNQEHFKIVENIANPKEYWDNVIVPQEREGLVIKNPKAYYEAGVRSKENLKLKNYKQVEVIIDNTEENPKGLKIYGKAVINGNNIEVEAQMGGIFNLNVGDKVPVEYLDIVGNKMIQPHKIKGWTTFQNGSS